MDLKEKKEKGPEDVTYVFLANKRLLGRRKIGTGDQDTEVAIHSFGEEASTVVEPPQGHGCPVLL